MADTTVAVTAGTGTPVQTFTNAAGNHEQYTRERRATAVTLDEWTISTTGVSARIAADVTRVGVIMANGGTGRVYLRFDTTIPTATSYSWFLEPGDRYEVPDMFAQRAISVLGAASGGELYTTLGTAA